MKDNLDDLLQQEMSRREFLSTLAYGLAAMVGVAGVLRMLGHKGFSGSQKADHGYGASAYGK